MDVGEAAEGEDGGREGEEERGLVATEDPDRGQAHADRAGCSQEEKGGHVQTVGPRASDAEEGCGDDEHEVGVDQEPSPSRYLVGYGRGVSEPRDRSGQSAALSLVLLSHDSLGSFSQVVERSKGPELKLSAASWGQRDGAFGLPPRT